MVAWKLFVTFVLALGLGLAVGWWLRENKAVEDCIAADGKWLPVAGHCSGSPWDEAET